MRLILWASFKNLRYPGRSSHPAVKTARNVLLGWDHNTPGGIRQ